MTVFVRIRRDNSDAMALFGLPNLIQKYQLAGGSTKEAIDIAGR
jgi:hypothetical protein